ncbi:MAG TPA: hypothetical protein VH599_17975 [Ktedonobacterales bacterium]|jgi:hypothetical protein
MRLCPNCGYQNDDMSAICIHCDRVLPPPAAPEEPSATVSASQSPVQLSAVPVPAQDGARKGRQYFLGLGLGLIPLLVLFLAIGLTSQQSTSNLAINLLYVSLALYIASIIAMIVCLSISKVRFVGYGLLTTVLASPVIGFIGCVVIVFSQPLF